MDIKHFGVFIQESFHNVNFDWNEETKELWEEREKKKGGDIETEYKLVLKGFPEILEYYILEDGEGKVKLTNGKLVVEVALSKLKDPKGWNGLFLEGETIMVQLHKDKIPLLLNAFLRFYSDRKIDVIDYEGIHGDELVITGRTITIFDDKPNRCRVEGNVSKVIEPYTKSLIDKEREFLKDNLENFRGVNAISWFAACWFKTKKMKFPILGDFRTTSKGKTAGMEAMLNITFGVAEYSKKACASLTDAQIKRFMTKSNVVPFIIDDFKANEKKNYRIDVENLIRSAHEGGTVVQATTSKDMIEFDVIRPMAITGENELLNESSNNRMVLVDDIKCPLDLYKKFTEDDSVLFKKLGYELLMKRLSASEDELNELYLSFKNYLEDEYPVVNSRILENYAVVKIGAHFINEILGTNFEPDIAMSEKTKYSIYDAIIELLKYTHEKGGMFYDFNDGAYALDFNKGFILIKGAVLFELYKKGLYEGIIQAESIVSFKEFKSKVVSEDIKLHEQKKINGKNSKTTFEIKINSEEFKED